MAENFSNERRVGLDIKGFMENSLTPWTDLAPSSLLIDWLTRHFSPPVLARALLIGCGRGDDAEELADWGFGVTAFDRSSEKVRWCRDRFIGSAVTYVEGDLLNPAPDLIAKFDFIYDSTVIPTLSPADRTQAILTVPHLLTPGGLFLAIYPLNMNSEQSVGDAVTLGELEALDRQLACIESETFYDNEDPPIRRILLVYRKPKKGA